MIVYDFLLTFIESFILSSFIFASVDLNQYKKSGLVLTFIFVVETFVFNNFYVNNLVLLITELITGMIFIFYYKKDIKFIYIFIICLSIGLIIVSNLVALSVVSIILQIGINSLSTNLSFYFLATILSKMVYFLISLVAYRIFKRNDSSLSLSKWWPLLLFFAFVLIMIIVIGESIVFNTINISTLWVLLVCLISSLLLAIYIYIKVNLDNKKQIELTSQLVKNKYINKNYDKMNYLYNKTIKERHEMMYVLLHVKNDILDNRYESALEILSEQISKTEGMQLLKSTQNPYFDYKMHEALDEYRNRGFKIKTSFSLGKIGLLSDETFIEELLNIIEYLSTVTDESKNMSIFLNQKNQNLIVLIDISSNCNKEDITVEISHKSISRLVCEQDENLITVKMLIELD